MRKWEKSLKEDTGIANQPAAFNRCINKVHEDMQDHIKTLFTNKFSKGKSSFSHWASPCHKWRTPSLLKLLTQLFFLDGDSNLEHLKLGGQPRYMVCTYKQPSPLYISLPRRGYRKCRGRHLLLLLVAFNFIWPIILQLTGVVH